MKSARVAVARGESGVSPLCFLLLPFLILGTFSSPSAALDANRRLSDGPMERSTLSHLSGPRHAQQGGGGSRGSSGGGAGGEEEPVPSSSSSSSSSGNPAARLSDFLPSPSSLPPPPWVAIIGAGMGGAYAAYSIKELLTQRAASPEPTHSAVLIDVFEAGSRVGGRALSFDLPTQASSRKAVGSRTDSDEKGPSQTAPADAVDLAAAVTSTFELGASIIWDGNLHLKEAAEKLGLPIQKLGKGGGGGLQRGGRGKMNGEDANATGRTNRKGASSVSTGFSGFSVYDGRNFVMNSTTSSWASLLWRYGPSPFLYARHVLKVVWGERFRRIYDWQAGGAVYDSPQDLLTAAGLWELTQESCASYIRGVVSAWWSWGGEAFATELAGAINRNNYNQGNEQLTALAGAVSYLPAAAGSDSLWSIRGGNWRLASALLDHSDAKVHLGSRVVKITMIPLNSEPPEAGSPGGGGDADEEEEKEKGQGKLEEEEEEGRMLYNLTLESGETYGPYDAVIIALPLEVDPDLVLEVLSASSSSSSSRSPSGRFSSSSSSFSSSSSSSSPSSDTVLSREGLAPGEEEREEGSDKGGDEESERKLMAGAARGLEEVSWSQHHQGGQGAKEIQAGQKPQNRGGSGSGRVDVDRLARDACRWLRCIPFSPFCTSPSSPSAPPCPVFSSSLSSSSSSSDPSPPPPMASTYQRTVTTYVVGNLQAAYFAVEALPLSGTVLVADNNNDDEEEEEDGGNVDDDDGREGVEGAGEQKSRVFVPFSTISAKALILRGAGNDQDGGDDGDRVLYKVFSRIPLNASLVTALFGSEAQVIQVADWRAAYPKYRPPEAFPTPFRLGPPGLCYINTIERAASAMEMSAIGGKNCALMTVQTLLRRPPLLAEV